MRNDFPYLAVSVDHSHASAIALPIVDRDTMLASAEHDFELLGQLIELFLAESPGLLAEIRAGVRDGDAESIERAAHTLRTALTSFGAGRVCQAAHQLELRARELRLDDSAQLLAALESDLAQACMALSEYLRTASR